MTLGLPSVWVWLWSGGPFRSVSKSSMCFSASIGVTRFDCFFDSSGLAVVEFNHINESARAVRPRRPALDEATWVPDGPFSPSDAISPKRIVTHYASPFVKREGSIM